MHRFFVSLTLLALAVPTVQAAEDAASIAAGLKSYDRAIHIKDGWIRDPYIILAPDGYYYLTGTTPLPDSPREAAEPYNTGLGPESIVGWKMQAWRSRDLITWESLGTPYTLKDGIWAQARPKRFEQVPQDTWRLWAPELHLHKGRWVIVHTSPSPVRGANLSVTRGPELKGPFDNPMGAKLGRRHDPSLYRDDDGTLYMLWGATQIAPLKDDLSAFAAKPTKIGPSGHRIGHEGCLMMKIGGKYVLVGTGWSTNKMRAGSYNLYYCVSDKLTGPYSERRFAGRFLGHGTPFQDKLGRWWCTAFFNANVPPLKPEEARGKDLSETAQTINQQGVTIVPIKVGVDDQSEPFIRAIPADYANPGPDEDQQFPNLKPIQ